MIASLVIYILGVIASFFVIGAGWIDSMEEEDAALGFVWPFFLAVAIAFSPFWLAMRLGRRIRKRPVRSTDGW